MGKPIQVTDIVERLVLLYKEIIEVPKIKITHLRPGEKLH
jgi:FlaA1/EpsC-like NDP-sugar epimerase